MIFKNRIRRLDNKKMSKNDGNPYQTIYKTYFITNFYRKN